MRTRGLAPIYCDKNSFCTNTAVHHSSVAPQPGGKGAWSPPLPKIADRLIALVCVVIPWRPCPGRIGSLAMYVRRHIRERDCDRNAMPAERRITISDDVCNRGSDVQSVSYRACEQMHTCSIRVLARQPSLHLAISGLYWRGVMGNDSQLDVSCTSSTFSVSFHHSKP